MMRNFSSLTAAVLAMVLICATISFARPEAKKGDEVAARKLVTDFSTCFNAKDAHACAMVFAEDGELTNARGETTRSRGELEKHFEMVFGGFLKNAHRTDSVRTVRFLSPTIASIDADWKLTGATSPNGIEPAPAVREGLLTWIVTKHDGQWYISIFHELDFPGK
jgi:uncharacterized protein (TIGR02246 family)